jgi:hypothetical protein
LQYAEAGVEIIVQTSRQLEDVKENLNMKVRFSLCRMVVLVACLAFAISCDDDDENTDVTEIGSVTLDVVAQDLAAPLVVTESTDNSGRLFIADQGGQIYIVKDGSRLPTPFLDIS